MKGKSVTEALLEMYYFQAIRDHFTSVFGARVLRILKPSQRQEGWVGFDQGWVRTELSNEQFCSELATALASGSSGLSRFYFGFFLQFKIVEIMNRRSRYSPPGFVADYFRSELDLTRSQESGTIQHHLLIALSRINGASVAYACPMFFDIDAIYDPPDLNQLRCVPVTDETPPFDEGERHFIAIQTPTDAWGFWCSQPIDMRHVSFADWVAKNTDIGPKPMDGMQLRALIESSASVARKHGFRVDSDEHELPSSFLPQSFTVIEMYYRSVEG
jgi:hypothetical protein